MSNCVFINQVENLPSESTLLIHYTITCSGLWDLVQLKTAYRNVCDTDWTVMYANDQHPRHSDFPVYVPNDGSYPATFAWNYGGIRGISSSNFDSNHSFLTQITLYNINCTGVNRSGDPSGSTSGQPGTTGSSYLPVPRPHRTFPMPPGPPGPPPPPSSTPPRPNLPGGPIPGTPGVVPGAPVEVRIPGQVTVTGGREGGATIEPSIRDRFNRNPSAPVLGGGVISEPIVQRYNSQAYLIDQNNFRDSSRVRSDLNRSIQDQRNGLGTLPSPNRATSQSSIVDPLAPLLENSSNNYFINTVNSTSKGKGINAVGLDYISQDSVLDLEAIPEEIDSGGTVVISSYYYPNNGSTNCKIEIHVLTLDNTSKKITETPYMVATKVTPITIASTIGLSNYNTKVFIVSKIISEEGTVLAVSSKMVHILPTAGEQPKRATDRLPEILARFSSVNSTPKTYTLYNNSPLLLLLENTTTSAGDILVHAKSKGKIGIRIEKLDTEVIPISVTSTIDYESRFSINGEEVSIGENNGWASLTNIDTAIMTFYPIENLEDICPIEVYIPNTLLLKQNRVVIATPTSQTANITVRTHYPYNNIKLVVNGYQKGKISSSNYTAIKATNIVGDCSFTSVPLKKDQWISLFVEENGTYNLSNPIIESKL